ncbi:MAG: hypothetical protein GX848_00575 [Clostridiales bacterium]|nr:hypothetical protein [Clostridiales bacterium]
MVFSDSDGDAESMFIIFLLILGIVSGLYMFKFLGNKEEQNVLLSVGLSRKQLILNRCAAFSLELLLAVVIPLLITLTINIKFFGFSLYSFKVCAFFIVVLFSVIFVGFTIGTLSSILAGTKIEASFTALSLTILPFGVIQFFYASFAFFLRGYSEAFESGVTLFPIFDFFNFFEKGENVMRYLNPLTMNYSRLYYTGILSVYSNLYDETQRVNWGVENLCNLKLSEFTSFFLWIFISLSVLLLCLFLLDRRKAENTGLFKHTKAASSIIISTVVLYTSGFGLAFGIFKAREYMKIGSCSFFVLDNYGKFLSLSYILLYAVVALFICLFLYTLNVKRLIKSLKFLPLALLALIIPVVCITGGLGFSTHTPGEGNISEISLEYPFAPNKQVFLNTWTNDTSRSVRYSGFNSSNDKKLVLSLHKLLTESDSKTQPYPIKIIYTLANGKKVERSYLDYSDEVILKLPEIFDSDTVKDYIYRRLADKASYLSTEDFMQFIKENPYADFDMLIREADLYNYDKIVTFELKTVETGEKANILTSFDKETYEQLLEAIATDYKIMDATDYYYPKEPCKYVLKLGVAGDIPNEFKVADSYTMHILPTMINTLTVLDNIKKNDMQSIKIIEKISLYECTVNQLFIQRFDTFSKDAGADYIAKLELKSTVLPYAVYENSNDIAAFSGKLHSLYATFKKNVSYALVMYTDKSEAVYIIEK